VQPAAVSAVAMVAHRTKRRDMPMGRR
jgi:hypothetical protein